MLILGFPGIAISKLWADTKIIETENVQCGLFYKAVHSKFLKMYFISIAIEHHEYSHSK